MIAILFNHISAKASTQMTVPFIPNTPEWHEGPDLEENWQDRYPEQEEEGD